MNRFRTKKRAKDEVPSSRPSVEADSSGPFRMFGKAKKARDEEVSEPLDLTAALPSNDDFRTSLLMTGLSARFSMLREQDDPTSKLGKASDDSVLFKRQSKMDFGMGNGLHDIAEVESIRASPFNRLDSFQSSDDGASISGSVMNRGKPTEGNNLFGGRQKIYRITPGGSSKPGVMSGRALYEDDVALSAFQKWKQDEKQRVSQEMDRPNGNIDSDSYLDFNRRRETNSTTSSGPSAARSSTAATSVTSQVASSLKDSSANSTTLNSSATTPVLERNTVTRTRRLYEQGLTQDLQDQQSIAQSRIDTLSRQRTFGTRTPDAVPNAASPTNSFADRGSERRPIITKASAPNLRSFSPPTTGSSQISPAESNSKFPGLEQRPSFGTNPPVSPPISESGDHPALAIQPNDRGKATAMGVFNRPLQQYDDSKYALRQRQMQQGRETPSNRFRTESNASQPTSRSRSSSSLSRAPYEKSEPATLKTEPTVQEETTNITFFDDRDDDEDTSQPVAAPQVTLQRPDDHEHPAFRKSALPTPLTLSARNSNNPSPTSDKNEFLNVHTHIPSEDSPTLGDGSGLSGMVRQHLRNDSTASSVYEPPAEDEDETQHRLDGAVAVPSIGDLGINSGGWGLNESDWKLSFENDSSPYRYEAISETQASASGLSLHANGVAETEQDEFARNLADGARRVREKLTSYVDSDSGTSTPVVPPSESSRDLSRSRSNAFGMLRSKSSRGSLVDKTREQRDRSQSRTRTSRLPVSSSVNATPALSPSKASANREDDLRQDETFYVEAHSSGQSEPLEKEESAHAGLKAFRQARRELQRMKEMEVQQRHQPPQRPPPRPSAPRAFSQETGPPPVMYNRFPSEESRGASRSRPGSRAASDRDRSGSDASLGGQLHGGPGRFRNGSLAHEEHFSPNGVNHGPTSAPLQGPMLRSPPSSAADEAKRSPMMPAGGSPGVYSRSSSSQSFGIQHDRVPHDSTRSSPVFAPAGSPMPYSGPSTPHGHTLGSTASTPNLHGGASAPPLPPINPRRKNGRPGTSRHSEEEYRVNQLHTGPSKTMEGRVHPAIYDDEVGPEQYRQRLRKVPSDAHNMNGRGRGVHHSPPTTRPPMPPASSAHSNIPGGLPGGMI